MARQLAPRVRELHVVNARRPLRLPPVRRIGVFILIEIDPRSRDGEVKSRGGISRKLKEMKRKREEDRREGGTVGGEKVVGQGGRRKRGHVIRNHGGFTGHRAINPKSNG